MILGVIADDFTGATDVASMLVRAGLRTVQVIGVPQGPPPAQADAVVVALKSRTTPAAQAVHDSLAALRWLQAGGARQFYFKYCSTFDSTAQGNIGPVTEALLEALNSDFTIACPAFPENGRTVFRGHLFVGDQLLSDSGMRDHPLTPMTDANLVRVLQAQCRGRVGQVSYEVVGQGVAPLETALSALRAQGVRVAVVDAIDNASLRTLAAACAQMPLLTAGSGLALGLPAVYASKGWVQPDAQAAQLPAVQGHDAVLSGSCSTATHQQVAQWLSAGRPAFRVDARALAAGHDVTVQALDWAAQQAGAAVLVYATAQPDEVRAIQTEWGVQQASQWVEACLARIAQGLVRRGVRRLVVAGGETSGAVVQALGITQLRIGATIDPGVPWTLAEAPPEPGAAPTPMWLALKSGNFGGVDFFAKALALRT